MAGDDSPRNVLVLSSRNPRRAPAPSRDRGSLIAHIVPTADEALRSLDRELYDIIVCPLEMAGDVPTLLRLRRVAPQTPLVALMPEPDRNLADLALESGATEVLSEHEDPGRSLGLLEGLSEFTDRLIRRSRSIRGSNQALLDRMGELLSETQGLVDCSMKIVGIREQDLRPLVVEDDADQALLLRRTFRKSGLELSLPVMPDGEAAVRYLQGEGEYGDRDRFPVPNLVLLDLHLPRKHGFEVLQWIRSQSKFRNLIVFVMTSSVLPEDLDRSLALGADFGFVKPVSLQHLEATVRRLLIRWGRIMKAHASRDMRPCR